MKPPSAAFSTGDVDVPVIVGSVVVTEPARLGSISSWLLFKVILFVGVN